MTFDCSPPVRSLDPPTSSSWVLTGISPSFGQLKEVSYDTVGHPRSDFKFSVAFPFHPHPDGRPDGEVSALITS